MPHVIYEEPTIMPSNYNFDKQNLNMFKKQYAGKRHWKKSLFLSGILLLSVNHTNYLYAQTLSSLKMIDVLDAAIATQESQRLKFKSTNFSINKASTWLASTPSIAVNYLKGDRKASSDEIEMSMNLPIKSAFQAQIDKELRASKHSFSNMIRQNQRLQLSAIIRDLVWNIEIVNMQLQTLQQKKQFIHQLENHYQQLFQASSVTQYPLLLIKQETLETDIEQLTLQKQLTNKLSEYQRVTGLTQLPENIVEEPIALVDTRVAMTLTHHPLLKKLSLSWLEQQQRLKLTSNKANAWNVSLTAKNVSNNTYQETQIGVGAEIPLNLFSNDKQVLTNEWLEAKGNYDLAYSQLNFELSQQLHLVLDEKKALTKKQQLLATSKALSKEIITETQLRMNANQIDPSEAIRRMLSAFHTKTQFNFNLLLLQKNTAMLKQAAGISL